VSGKHTENGHTIFSGDPHLSNTIPVVWYPMELYSADGEYHATGVTIPGMPGFAMGRTNETAWALTNSKIDNADWFLEKIEDDKYLHGDEWKTMKKRVEIIKVKGQEDLKHEIFMTNHGLDIDCPLFKGFDSPTILQRLTPYHPPVDLENFAFCWAISHKSENSLQSIV